MGRLGLGNSIWRAVLRSAVQPCRYQAVTGWHASGQLLVGNGPAASCYGW